VTGFNVVIVVVICS